MDAELIENVKMIIEKVLSSPSEARRIFDATRGTHLEEAVERARSKGKYTVEDVFDEYAMLLWEIGFEEGYREGLLEVIQDRVRNGSLSVARGAALLNISENDLRQKMVDETRLWRFECKG